MLYAMVHRDVIELRIAGELTGTASLLYELLACNCDVKSGIVRNLSVAQVSRALRCHRSSVHRAAARLNELALLSPGTDTAGNCLSGSLPHVKECYEHHRKSKSASLRDVKTPTPSEARAARIHSSAPPPVYTAPPDSRNGSGTPESRARTAGYRQESGI